ncbi:hypothetical protein LJC45_03475 [Alistipes sp. OttesenSCG-928-B03]|nr:hypothetical protein [Alistipes sp. OttesenSCG-928-B03]
MKLRRLLAVAYSAIMMVGVMSGCGEKQAAIYTITPEGVGPVTFTFDVPQMKGYTVESVVEEEFDEEYKVLNVTDAEGKVVIRRTEDYLIEVLGEEFKTDTGIHVGMPVVEAVEKMGGEPEIFNPWPSLEFLFTVDDVIAYVVAGQDLKGGVAELEEYSLRPFDVTVESFRPDTRITAIKIKKD